MRPKAGNAPLMHNHDTNETFIPTIGLWRCSWKEGDANESIDRGPLDVASFPPDAARCVENVTPNEPDAEHVIIFVVAGTAPETGFTQESGGYAERAHGIYEPARAEETSEGSRALVA